MDLDILLSLMKERHLKQADLCRATGRSNASVSDWISKGATPRIDDGLAIADLLGVSVRYLVTGKDDKQLLPRERKLLEICSSLTDDKFEAVLKVAEILNK